MNLQHRLNLLNELGIYLRNPDDAWQQALARAEQENGWFIPEFTQHATDVIARRFLVPAILQEWTAGYELSEDSRPSGTVGLVMAGNIPLAGFHDWICVFLAGHRARIRPSSKDQVLIRKLTEKMIEFDASAAQWFEFSERLNHCDAYIATGSNNSSRYFEFYFRNHPHIIRKNRSSVAILDGRENSADLERLADDVFLYFGLGCRNVTKIYVPESYDFLPLLAAFKKYGYLMDHHKYKNNYDYNLALHLLNRVEYMSSGNLLLVKETSIFSPVSQLNYEYYADLPAVITGLQALQDLQCIVGAGHLPFGMAQEPAINDYPDGVDTLEFLSRLTIRS